VTTFESRITQERATLPVAVTLPRRAGAAPLPPAPTAFLMLAGGLRHSPLSAAARRSVLDLALTPARTALEFWLERVDDLTDACDGPRPEVRVIHNHHTFAPSPPIQPAMGAFTSESEAKDYRGPAGVARDACDRYAPDATILLVEGSRCMTGSLAGIVREHAATGATVTVGCNPDMSPAGIYAVRRSAFDHVPGGGFMDLKEQWLSRLVAAKEDVRVHVFTDGASHPMRTLAQYLSAVRAVNPQLTGGEDPHASIRSGNDSESHFRPVVQRDASIDPSAIVIDSVVMAGAVVGPGAVVARSLICPDAVVHRDSEIVEGVVAGSAPMSAQRSDRKGKFWSSR